MKRIFLLCAASLSLALANVRAAEVTATLEPAQVAVGETAELTVTTTGSDNDAPAVPSVPGLDIAHVGQSTQAQIVNGSMTVSSVQTFEVTPQRGGTFTIPVIQVGGGRSRPLTLHVTGNSNGAASPPVRRGTPPGSNAAPATLPPPGVQMPPTNAAAPAGSRYGFIQLVVPKKQFYVGEVVPVEVNAFVPAGMQATANGLPTMGSEAFTLNPLGNKPEHGQREVGGRDYTVLTWHSAVTAVKAGDFPLSMEMPATVVVREAPQRRQRDSDDPFDQLFNNPFFAGQFSALGKQKEVTLASEPEVLAVLPLPTANRPADFTGAVGRFEIKASATPVSVAAGDPITLRVAVSGAGAFDRASTDGLANSAAGWKTYPPKSTFEAADSVGYQGTKTFEQVVIPKDDGVKEIPALRFSFFDPETQRYEIRATTPIPVQVTGAPANFAATTTAVAAASPAPAAPDLVPNKVETGRAVATLRPVFLSPWFLGAQGLPLGALGIGLAFIRRKRRFAADPRLARANAATRAIQSQLDAMDQAMRQHAAPGFSWRRGARCSSAWVNAGASGPRPSRWRRLTPGSTARAKASARSSRWRIRSAIPARHSATPTIAAGPNSSSPNSNNWRNTHDDLP